MKPGCAIALIVLVVIAAAVAFGVGASRHEKPKDEKSEDEQIERIQKNPLTQGINDVTGWLAPKIDLKQVKVGGLPVTDPTIPIPKNGSVTIAVEADKDGSQSRRLRLILVEPSPPGGQLAVQLDYVETKPLPGEMKPGDLPDDSETVLPNPDLQAKHRDVYVLPIFVGGATITCTNKLDRKVVIRLE